jgi:hypothetical protein
MSVKEDTSHALRSALKSDEWNICLPVVTRDTSHTERGPNASCASCKRLAQQAPGQHWQVVAKSACVIGYDTAVGAAVGAAVGGVARAIMSPSNVSSRRSMTRRPGGRFDLTPH